MKYWLIRGAMVALAILIAYVEGSLQPSPGIGFGVAMMLMLGAALIGPVDVCQCNHPDCGGGCWPPRQ